MNAGTFVIFGRALSVTYAARDSVFSSHFPKQRLTLYKTHSKTLCKEINYFNGSEISSLWKLWSALYSCEFVDQVIILNNNEAKKQFFEKKWAPRNLSKEDGTIILSRKFNLKSFRNRVRLEISPGVYDIQYILGPARPEHI